MSAETNDFAQLRRAMVDNQLRTFSVIDRAVLARMLAVPREEFVGPDQAAIAYSDSALMVEGRRMLSPMILGRLIQSAKLEPADRVLDVGGAAGYSAAVLAGLCSEVVALEASDALTRAAADNLRRAGIGNVRAVTGPLDAGFAAAAPYDVIFVNGMVETGVETLLSQLAEGGRLLAIRRQPGDGSGRAGRASIFEKSGGKLAGVRDVFEASASPLPGFREAPAFAF